LKSKNCEVYGIEINADAAESARAYCTEVQVGDLDLRDLSSFYPGNKFDRIIFGDVLEHLKNPEAVLESAHAMLSSSGRIVASIPNIAHGAVRLALLNGEFDYSELGILDSTHLRFFTLDTVREMFLKAGFEIEDITRTVHQIFTDGVLVPVLKEDEFPENIVAEVSLSPESETLQFVFAARALQTAERREAVFNYMASLRRELTQLKRAIQSGGRGMATSDSRTSGQGRSSFPELRATLAQREREVSALTSEANVFRYEVQHWRKIYEEAQAALVESRVRLVEVNAEKTLIASQLENASRRSLGAQAELTRVYARNTELLTLESETRRLFDEREAEVVHLRNAVHRLEAQVDEMQRSKVWRLRSKWHSVRRSLGI
jgi:O-antigen biosynthesis protein